jgi:putative selenate reductase
VPREAPVPREARHRVAIVGGGPSGLAAAYFLALSGVKPVIYEARDRAGGMCAIAADFRLPDAVVQEDIDRIEGLGAEIRLSHVVTDPPEKFLDEGYDAVYVAPGAQKDAHLGIDGEDGEGVHHALELLERVSKLCDVSRGESKLCGVGLEGDVLVIGGGNTAMDAARTARRLTGGSVTVVYRRTKAQMPADDEEVEAIFDEDIRLEELASPTEIVLDEGRVVALECTRNELGEPGADGRRRPVPVAGSEFQIPAKAVIVAIGQRYDVSFLGGSGVSLSPRQTIDVHPETGLAAEPGLYAGGDVVRGPATIIKACADGQRAAEAICHRLGVPFRRPDVEMPTLSAEQMLTVKRLRTRRVPQHASPMLSTAEREGFDLVEQTLPEETALAEALRCLQCSQVCDKCVEVCPNRANYTYLIAPAKTRVPRLACRDGELRVVGEEMFEVTQTRQILHVADFCNECGNCETFCVHNGRPFADKPRLFLSEDDFGREEGNAFHIKLCGQSGERGWTIRRREGGEESSLMLEGGDGGMTFESQYLHLRLGPDTAMTSMTLKERFEGEFSLAHAAEMVLILKGVLETLPFLLL